MARLNFRPVLLTIVLLVLPLCFSQTDGVVEPDTAAKTETAPLANPIETRITQLQADTTMEAEAKQKLIDVYKSTLEQNRLTASMAAKSQAFIKAKTEAPDKIASLKKNIEQPSAPAPLDIPKDATLDVLSQMLVTAQGKLDVANKLSDSIKTDIEFRKNRQTEILESSAKAENRLQEIGGKIDAKGLTPEATEFDRAMIEQTKALKKAVEQEIELYKNESASYQAEAELLKLRKDSALVQVQQSQEAVNKLQELVNAKRKQEAEEAAKKATEAVDTTDPAVKHIAEENAKLAEQRTAVDSPASKIISVTQRTSELEKTLKSVKDNQKIVTQKIEAASITKMIGILLQKQKKELPNRRILKGNLNKTQAEISLIQQRMLEIEEQLLSVDNIDDQVKEISSALDKNTSNYKRNKIEDMARQLLQTKRDYLNALYSDCDTYFKKLYDLYELQNKLLSTTDDFRHFINENILWYRNYHPLSSTDITNTYKSAKWLFSRESWESFRNFIIKDASSIPAYYLFGSALSLLLLIRIRKVTSKLTELGTKPGTEPSQLFKDTLKAIFFTAQLSVTLALPVFLISWRLALDTGDDEYPRAVGFGLLSAGIMWFTLEFSNKLFMPKGLGQTHLNWNLSTSSLTLKHFRTLKVIVLPAAYISSTFRWQSNEVYHGSLGRIAFIIALCVSSFCIHGILKQPKNPNLSRLRLFLRLTATATPLIIAVIAAFGYYYTAYIITVRLIISLWLVLGVSITDSLLRRWLYVVKWNMAVKKHQQQREKPGEKDPIGKAVEKATEVKISDLGVQARKLQRTLISILLIMGLWLIWVDVLPALGVLNRIELWTHSVKQNIVIHDENGGDMVSTIQKITPVTLADLLMAIGVMVITAIATRNTPGLLEITVLRRLPVEFGTKFAITSVSRYIIIIAGIIFASSIISIGWSKVQWLAAAFSVGLGFGLQEIFSNFISGIIILFEQPIRVGDTVTIGDVSGVITKIKSRATTITTWERKEMIVPNKEFITSRLVNWTLSDRILRVEVPVGIAYGSDTQKAHDTLLKVATEHPMVIKDPEPSVLFLKFDDSALYFEMRCFITCIESFLQVKHELNMQIDQAFRQAGITIAFPQLDVHIIKSDDNIK